MTDAAMDQTTLSGTGSELLLASQPLKDGLMRTELSVPDVHCGACIRRVEKAIGALDGVQDVRVNLSTRRVTVNWRGGDNPPPLKNTLDRLGYSASYFDEPREDKDKELGRLIRALAVAGFAASNIMMLSASVWSGAEGDAKLLFHWLSGLLALPTLAYSGRIFFVSALNALRHGRTNMDVPISLGVTLAFCLSVYETVTGGHHAYFDASVTLLFFLLIGRTLDHVMRERARTAVRNLARLEARGATRIRPDGGTEYVPVASIAVGDTLIVSAGGRFPVDGLVVAGNSEVDSSMVTGESDPQEIAPGAAIKAGTLNLAESVTLRANAAAADSFLAEMVRLMEAAEGGRARYRRIADRAAQLYSPVVHLTAAATLLGWILITGDWHASISTAIVVLIITCPCALGLAVPMVQIVAARRLFESGVMVKDGAGLERLTGIDTVVLDKTGTVTVGVPQLSNADEIAAEHLALAAAMAAHSSHPISRSLAGLAPSFSAAPFARVSEVSGFGLEAEAEGSVYRLGRSSWAMEARTGEQAVRGTVLTCDGTVLAEFRFEDRLRPDARAAIDTLKDRGLTVLMLSGDHEVAVARVAQDIGLTDYRFGVSPRDKVEAIEKLKSTGHKVLMVGDGLNDAPALSAATVSIAPASAADIGRNAADFVFMRNSLNAVPLTMQVATDAGRLIRQNLAFAVAYNAVAVPIAVLGYVTPLVAAVAMSLSSVAVVANSLRLPGTASRGRFIDLTSFKQAALK